MLGGWLWGVSLSWLTEKPSAQSILAAVPEHSQSQTKRSDPEPSAETSWAEGWPSGRTKCRLASPCPALCFNKPLEGAEAPRDLSWGLEFSAHPGREEAWKDHPGREFLLGIMWWAGAGRVLWSRQGSYPRTRLPFPHLPSSLPHRRERREESWGGTWPRRL